METIIPWQELTEVIEPCYPNPPGAGRRPVGVERMLRIDFLQHGFNVSDPGAEEALYDSRAMRHFVGIDLGNEPVPDETTIGKFRHRMERHRGSAFPPRQRLSPGERPQGGARHPRGRHPPQRAELDQEPGQGEGSEPALHPQGQPVVLWH